MISKTIKHNFGNPKKIRELCLEKIKDREGRIGQEDNTSVCKDIILYKKNRNYSNEVIYYSYTIQKK